MTELSDPRTPIAIIGLGCRYPGARSPKELWENVLARRQSFRRMPDERLPLSEYWDPDKSAPDKTYGTRAAVIDGFNFDWARRRIPKQVFEQTDITHWLALDVALGNCADLRVLLEDITGVRSLNIEDARVAIDAGADMLGFILYPKSPRYVEPETVSEIVAKIKAQRTKIKDRRLVGREGWARRRARSARPEGARPMRKRPRPERTGTNRRSKIGGPRGPARRLVRSARPEGRDR